MSIMIFGPDGVALARKTVIPMTARQTTWFIDPEALLRHLADFPVALKVSVYCKRCYERGLNEDVTAHFNASKNTWTAHCECADYPEWHPTPKGLVARRTLEDGTVQSHTITSVDEFLWRCNWALKCTADCAKAGMHDGVQGDNDPAGKSLKVICGCTERVYAETVH